MSSSEFRLNISRADDSLDVVVVVGGSRILFALYRKAGDGGTSSGLAFVSKGNLCPLAATKRSQVPEDVRKSARTALKGSGAYETLLVSSAQRGFKSKCVFLDLLFVFAVVSVVS